MEYQISNKISQHNNLKSEESYKYTTNIPWEKESADTNACLNAKLKVSVFENGQFSRNLIFDKKTFFSEKNCFFYLDKQELCFFEKKTMLFFFFFKCFFLEIFFQKKFKKFIEKFFVRRKVLEILKKTFSKKFFQKNIFFLKRNIIFFSKKQSFSLLG